MGAPLARSRGQIFALSAKKAPLAAVFTSGSPSHDMEDLSDGRLLAAWQQGDASAFAGLVARHQGRLLRQARGLLGPGSAYEDAVQEALLELARAKLRLPADVEGDPERERRHVAGWLAKVTRNKCMDVIRGEARRRRHEKSAAAPESTGGGLSSVEAEDTRAMVERELMRLPVDQRDVLVLRLLAERSYREIAEITGKKVGTVGWLISEGLSTLSRRLAHLVDPNATHPSGSALDALGGEAR